jgi:ABC-2 type transport system ATP-binding protein
MMKTNERRRTGSDMKKETDGQRETVIEGKELNYTYPGTKTPVWEKNLTFTIDKGEIVGLAGQNGSGKSTLLRLLAGFIPWEINRCSGQMITGISERDMACVIDRPSFFSDLSVRDNLRLMDRMNGEKGLMDEKLAELLGIHEFDRIKASKLSLGNKQKLALCLAIHRKTKLALLDEPLNGLDPFTKASVLSCLRKWRKQGMAVILTSHIPGDLEQICDRILYL